MTGHHVRAMVDGRWQSVEIDRLDDEALAAFVAGLGPDQARRWVVALARWIRDEVREAGSSGHLEVAEGPP
jgi:hypothetical protein